MEINGICLQRLSFGHYPSSPNNEMRPKVSMSCNGPYAVGNLLFDQLIIPFWTADRYQDREKLILNASKMDVKMKQD